MAEECTQAGSAGNFVHQPGLFNHLKVDFRTSDGHIDVHVTPGIDCLKCAQHSTAQHVEHSMVQSMFASSCLWWGLLETCTQQKYSFCSLFEHAASTLGPAHWDAKRVKKQGSTCSPELNLPLKLRPAIKAASTSFKHFSMVSSSLRAAVSLPLGPPRMALTYAQPMQAVN